MDSPEPEESEPGGRPWMIPALAGFALLLAAAGIGFGIGKTTVSRDPGPDLTRAEAFVQARKKAEKEVSRQMARRGFDAGRRSGHSHGIIAGGMAAESAVTIQFRQQRASVAQSDAAEVQSELAGMTAAPAPPVPTPEPDDG